ncbi:MAG: LLM class flavin-dependent oxidoreductase [Streptosporangiaceae bacterium]|nr:LLM class flavin-dependent oxidoreductase [Streptosporangiaceae bacterium]MBV9858212.1 LLM class flavin-dependent oxidoreductase [Streptosporangiaceae bacterium]
MKFFGFHLMPYQDLPAGHLDGTASSWVTLSNALFDPEKGHRLYRRYIEELIAFDRAGFDGICVNEHHQTAYGLMPSPDVMAAVLVPQTTCRIAILGNALPLRDHPLRVAEEVAMLDVISGGRIISGFVRGIGAEYHTFGVDPASSRERFHEAHDLIVAAWTRPGPFEWYGKHYKFRYVNPWPRPLQQPHPPIWSPSQGSGETIDWAAKHRYTYLQTYSELASVRRVFDEFRAAAQRYGYTAAPEQIGWSIPVFVADTDERAEEVALPALDRLFNKLMRMPRDVFFPAGYLTPASSARVMAAKGGLGSGNADVRDLVNRGYAVIGSPDTVRQRLEAHAKELGFGCFCGVFQFGSLGHEDFLASLHLFTQKVMPALRAL